MIVSLTVNGFSYDVECAPSTLLVHLLRDQLRLTGTHIGCDTSACGACTILLDGRAVKSCTLIAPQADGRVVETVEGLDDGGALAPLQESFAARFALQCGFCTSGFLMAATALLSSDEDPTEADVRKAISGNLCRCTGYQHIVDAVLDLAKGTG